MIKEPDVRVVADWMNAKGRADRLARERRIWPWFNGFLYLIPVTAGVVGTITEGSVLGALVLLAFVVPLSTYVTHYLQIMAAFEAAGIGYAKQEEQMGAERIAAPDPATSGG